jgi:S-DNA-T family DNA segregation ATPase FtsK/SpoIIIE
MSRRTHKAQTPEKPSSQTSDSESTLSVLDRFGGWWLRVRKYGWDVFGVILLAFTIISLLGLVRLTSGKLIDAWIGLLDRLFGWGAAIMVGLVGLAGISALRQHYEKLPDLKISKVLALEGMAFGLIAFFAAINGGDLDRAQNGLDGGIVGYGLITPLLRILPGWFGAVISGLITILFGYFGLGLDDRVTRLMEKWLGSTVSFKPI